MSEPKTMTITLVPGHEDWRSVVEWLRKPQGWATLGNIVNQIEAQLPKPKPEEPSEDWSVAYSDGYYYVRWPDLEARRWSPRGGGFYDWEDILAKGDVEIIR